MLLITLEDDVLGFAVAFEGRVKHLLLFALVRRNLGGECVQDVAAALAGPGRRFLTLFHQPLEPAVVLFEDLHRVVWQRGQCNCADTDLTTLCAARTAVFDARLVTVVFRFFAVDAVAVRFDCPAVAISPPAHRGAS